jgi:hypothetical protein
MDVEAPIFRKEGFTESTRPMSTQLIVRDYFSEFSKLVKNQKVCALILLDFFKGKDTLPSEIQAKNASKRYMSEIISQKNEKLFPFEKERFCLALSELIFRSQLSLLRIPELFRIYRAERYQNKFEDFLPTVVRCCDLLESFSLQAPAQNRFLKNSAEPILDCCLEGFKCCTRIDLSEENSKERAFDLLILKDIDEEFASFFLISLKFTHLALHFPM